MMSVIWVIRLENTYQIAICCGVHGSASTDDTANQNIAKNPNKEDDPLDSGTNKSISGGEVLLLATSHVRNADVGWGLI